METRLLVELQNNFFPGGALAIPKVDEVFPLVQAGVTLITYACGKEQNKPPLS